MSNMKIVSLIDATAHETRTQNLDDIKLMLEVVEQEIDKRIGQLELMVRHDEVIQTIKTIEQDLDKWTKYLIDLRRRIERLEHREPPK